MRLQPGARKHLHPLAADQQPRDLVCRGIGRVARERARPLPHRVCARTHEAADGSNQLARRDGRPRSEIEVVVLRKGIENDHPRATPGRLAHAMIDQRLIMARITPNDEHRVRLFERCERAPQGGK